MVMEFCRVVIFLFSLIRALRSSPHRRARPACCHSWRFLMRSVFFLMFWSSACRGLCWSSGWCTCVRFWNPSRLDVYGWWLWLLGTHATMFHGGRMSSPKKCSVTCSRAFSYMCQVDICEHVNLWISILTHIHMCMYTCTLCTCTSYTKPCTQPLPHT